MMPINSVQLAMMMQMQQMQQMQQIQQIQQMQQINNILQTSMPVYPQQQNVSDDEDSDDDEVSKTLFIANLDDRVDEEVIFELFLQAGPLEKVHIPKNRNFGFITYTHTCSAIYAMNLFQGMTLFGKPLGMKYKSKTNVPPLVKRILPPDWGVINNNSKHEQNQRNFENSAIRNPFADNDNGRRYDGRDHASRDGNGRDRNHNNRWSDSSRDRSDRERDRHYEDRRGSNRHGDNRGSYYS